MTNTKKAKNLNSDRNAVHIRKSIGGGNLRAIARSSKGMKSWFCMNGAERKLPLAVVCRR
jgi:hypothetical protein